MCALEMNGNGADWYKAPNKAATSRKTRSCSSVLKQYFQGSDTEAKAFVSPGNWGSAAAALMRLFWKGGCKGKRAAVDNNATKKPNADEDTVQSDSVDEKIAAVKEQIADLLDTIEALMPGFAKKVKPWVESNAAWAKSTSAVADAIEKEATKAALEELARMLEEIIALLRGPDESDKPGDTEATPNNYAVDKATSQDPKEKIGSDAVDAFMSIYDQMSGGAKREVAEIFASMAFKGKSHPTFSNEHIEDNNCDVFCEFTELVGERSGTETSSLLNLDIAGTEVSVADGQWVALIEEPVLIDGKIVTDGVIVEAGDSVTLADGRVLTLNRYNTMTVEDPKTGLRESVTLGINNSE